MPGRLTIRIGLRSIAEHEAQLVQDAATPQTQTSAPSQGSAEGGLASAGTAGVNLTNGTAPDVLNVVLNKGKLHLKVMIQYYQ